VEVEMAEESKLTIRIGVLMSCVASLIVFILGALWVHNTEISRLHTNQTAVMKNAEVVAGALVKADEKLDRTIERIYDRMAAIDDKLAFMTGTQMKHRKVSEDNQRMLRKEPR
jgi:hypothetical protein